MKKFIILFSVLIIFIASCFLGYNLINKTSSNKDTMLNKTNTINTTPELKTPTVPETKKEIKQKLNYDILGSSTKYPDEAMKKWRKDMVDLVGKSPSNLFINGGGEDKVVALTFDDGPDGVNTPNIINILREYRVQATFFCVGTQIEKNQALIDQAFKDGNLIASHSWSHPDFTKISEDSLNAELTLTENEIFKVIGKKPAIIRPPYGAVNDNVLNMLISKQYVQVLWSTDTLDWDQKESDNIVKNVIDNVRPGEIILMHCDSGKKATADALPTIITKLKEMGYGFVTLDKLLNCPGYKNN